MNPRYTDGDAFTPYESPGYNTLTPYTFEDWEGDLEYMREEWLKTRALAGAAGWPLCALLRTLVDDECIRPETANYVQTFIKKTLKVPGLRGRYYTSFFTKVNQLLLSSEFHLPERVWEHPEFRQAAEHLTGELRLGLILYLQENQRQLFPPELTS